MSKKLLFNGGGSTIVDVPFENGAIGNTLRIGKSFSNMTYVKYRDYDASLKLQYLSGEDAGYIKYIFNTSGYVQCNFLHKDGTVIYTNKTHITDILIKFDDLFKITELNNFINIEITIEN